jgi:hypothetical protein
MSVTGDWSFVTCGGRIVEALFIAGIRPRRLCSAFKNYREGGVAGFSGV